MKEKEVNKGVLMRLLVLDRLLGGNVYYDQKGLTAKVNQALEGQGIHVSESTIRDDLEFLESTTGFNAPIKRWNDGHWKLIAYSNPNFSIMNMPLTYQQAQLLGRAIGMLNNIKGLPTFRWLEPMVAVLKQEFGVDGTPQGTVMLAQNENLTGLEWFGQLHEDIVQKIVVEVTYQRFGKKPKTRAIHPYQLKQYNNRWFLIGAEEANQPRLTYVVVPLDRIKGVKELTREKYIPKEEGDNDFREYFQHIVGVSLLPEGEVKKVKVKVWYPNAWYMETKPVHWTQKVVEETAPWIPAEKEGEKPKPGYKVFEMEVIPNEELVQQLMVYGDQLEVLEPEWVRLRLIDRAKAILVKNGIR